MKIVFTGTRHGLSEYQCDMLYATLERCAPEEARHGDCIGGDRRFHLTCLALVVPSVVIHPPVRQALRAHCHLIRTPDGVTVTVLPPEQYIARDRAMVETRPDMLIAMPATAHEQLHSGTWTTVRYARKLKLKDILVIPPTPMA